MSGDASSAAPPDLGAAVMPEAPAPGRARRWFAADGARLAIDVPARAEAAHEVEPLHDAVLLGEHDALLGELAELCDTDFAWCPVEAGSPASDLDFTLLGADGAHRLGLALPEGLTEPLRARAAAPPAADGVRLVAHVATVRLVLARLALEPEEAHRIGPGALVLLPAAFGPRWPVALEPVEGGAALAGRLDGATGAVFAEARAGAGTDAGAGAAPGDGASAAGGAEAVPCTVSLAATPTVRLDPWAAGGGAGGRAGPGEAPAFEARIGDGAEAVLALGGESPREWRGGLATIGRGRGVLLWT